MRKRLLFVMLLCALLMLAACSQAQDNAITEHYEQESAEPSDEVADLADDMPDLAADDAVVDANKPEDATSASTPLSENTAEEVSPMEMPIQTEIPIQAVSDATPEPAIETVAPATSEIPEPAERAIEEIKLSVDGVPLNVVWEDNESMDALIELLAVGAITVGMEQYGGFEQVGRLPHSLPHNDVQMTAQPGDIVLYSGNQIVLFFGSNSWAYTKLGHISDLSAEDLTAVLDHASVNVVISGI